MLSIVLRRAPRPSKMKILILLLLSFNVSAALSPYVMEQLAAQIPGVSTGETTPKDMHEAWDRYEATVEMYKKEGANPLGGCLPILLQMPVFLALYWTLMESVELRQAPFLLWIDDLSVMDPYFVLPILMGISMYLTQMMQPEPPDPIQAKVFKFLPIMMTFFFLWFPAGLVLYWLINNILSVLQQLYVTRSLEKAG